MPKQKLKILNAYSETAHEITCKSSSGISFLKIIKLIMSQQKNDEFNKHKKHYLKFNLALYKSMGDAINISKSLN